MCDDAKAVFKGKLVALNAFIRREISNQWPPLLPLNLEKWEWIKPNVGKRRKVIKIKEKISKIEKTIAMKKINKTKG